LVILCTSDRPDPYFNVIAHASLVLGIREFLLVAVGDDIRPELAERAAMIADELSKFVEQLAAGKYWRRDHASGMETVEDLTRADRFSSVVDELGWGSLRISRVGLPEDRLNELLQKEVSEGAAFDVTSCKNSAVAGAVAWLVSRGGSPIYSFELRKTPTYRQDDLLPAMEHGQYMYRDLSTSPLLEDAVRKVNAFSLNREKFFYVSLLLAIVVGLISMSFSQTVAFSVVTAFASFASIISALTFFLRE
jgi:hypothetical protein